MLALVGLEQWDLMTFFVLTSTNPVASGKVSLMKHTEMGEHTIYGGVIVLIFRNGSH